MIGIIGLGLVGSALCKRFLEMGFEVVGYDISAKATNQAKRSGAQISDSPKQIGLLSNIILLSLPDSTIVDLVVEGPNGLLETISENSLIIDTTTSDPNASAELAQRLRKCSIRFIDATIIGSSNEIENGSAVLLCGGLENDITENTELFSIFSKRFFHMGKNGKGAQTKLVVNLVLGLNRLALAEGINLGEKIGLNPNRLLEVLKSGAAYSRAMDHKGEKMVNNEFDPPQAKLAQHHKDVDLILKLAQQTGVSVPLTVTHEKILSMARLNGLGELDNSAVIQILRTLGSEEI
ncbi:MAG: NAD(P)-dependent oxidoreductase [Candidatus Latescibacterota bacterium]|nr:NAD(P)-dependent oxidoreductase [Candidatus Latescibacterota bacterium]